MSENWKQVTQAQLLKDLLFMQKKKNNRTYFNIGGRMGAGKTKIVQKFIKKSNINTIIIIVGRIGLANDYCKLLAADINTYLYTNHDAFSAALTSHDKTKKSCFIICINSLIKRFPEHGIKSDVVIIDEIETTTLNLVTGLLPLQEATDITLYLQNNILTNTKTLITLDAFHTNTLATAFYLMFNYNAISPTTALSRIITKSKNIDIHQVNLIPEKRTRPIFDHAVFLRNKYSFALEGELVTIQEKIIQCMKERKKIAIFHPIPKEFESIFKKLLCSVNTGGFAPKIAVFTGKTSEERDYEIQATASQHNQLNFDELVLNNDIIIYNSKVSPGQSVTHQIDVLFAYLWINYSAPPPGEQIQLIGRLRNIASKTLY